MRYAKTIISIGILSIVFLLYKSGLIHYLNIENFKQYRDVLQEHVAEHYWFDVVVYCMVYMMAISSALPLATVLSLIGGFLFGFFPALVYVNIAATAGATITFVVVRYLLGEYVQRRYAASLVNFNYEMHRYGSWYLLAVHFATVIPFGLINVCAGLTRVSPWTFLWTTSIGILPGTGLYIYAGRELGSINNMSDLVSFKMIMIFAILAFIALMPVIWHLVRDYRAGHFVHMKDEAE